MYIEFGVDMDGIKRVAEFLVLNDSKIIKYDLKNIYKSRTPDTLQLDQNNPIVGEVEDVINLPMVNINQGDVYFVSNPYPGKYFIWNDGWTEDPESRNKSRSVYIDSLYQERGYKIWEDDYGYFVATENDVGETTWVGTTTATPDYTIIRKSELPRNPVLGTIYEVLGEDLIDIVASLYGLVDMGMTPPWDKYVSGKQTNLRELLNMTIYLYRYGVTDNFYEKNIWQFIPEYDRDQMLEQPKIKLFMESIGRKLDQLEDKLTRLQDIYDIDETPDELLDYLGQMLGYEREDFSLSSVSFRELLKNIIEIYKIKGTNYSFSFFFKFLGFNVNLKEFYFNRNVRNPEAFPGVDERNVEFYLTTTNPTVETKWGNPAPFLQAIRSLNDWEMEKTMLISKGCANVISYMLGKETYNNDNFTCHKNPWMNFKTNLIEYQLNPFFDKVNLTSSDNETIRKYIKFLSPTYLFTWINVNLLPWIEDFNISETLEDTISAQIIKTIGDSSQSGFNDYENVVDYLQVWDSKSNKLLPYLEADDMIISIVNNLNLGGDDKIGAYLRRDGAYIRQPGHPSHITNIYHNGATHISFDNLGIMIKDVDTIDYDNYYDKLIDRPLIADEDSIAYVKETDLYYIFKDPSPYWELIESQQGQIPPDNISSTYLKLIQRQDVVIGDVYKTADTGRFYKYHNDNPLWIQTSDPIYRYKKWMDYSYRPFPAYPVNVKPAPGIKLKTNVIDFVWDEIYAQQGYWIQVARDVNFIDIIEEKFIYDGKNYIKELQLDNNNYYWRIRTKNNIDTSQFTTEEFNSMLSKQSDAIKYFSENNGMYALKTINSIELNDLLRLLSLSGNKFNWGEWSPVYRFESFGLPFPKNNQIINNINYKHIKRIGDMNSSLFQINVEWIATSNTEAYEVIISKKLDFSQVIISNKVETNSLTVDIPNGTYFWKYRAKKFNKDWQDWSNIMQFLVQI